jgi:DNA-binding XRE family transcriptional regulator
LGQALTAHWTAASTVLPADRPTITLDHRHESRNQSRNVAKTKKSQSLQDVADAVQVSKAHIWQLEKGRADNPSIDLITRLAYLSPDVLERLVIHRQPPALSLNDLMAIPDLPWLEQMERVFGSDLELSARH